MNLIVEKQKNLNEEAKKFCQDRNNSLDERWQLVLNFGNTTHSINFGFPEIDSYSIITIFITIVGRYILSTLYYTT
jgi:hypothetical protein